MWLKYHLPGKGVSQKFIQHFCVLDLGVKKNAWSVIPEIPWLPVFWINKTAQKTPTKPSYTKTWTVF